MTGQRRQFREHLWRWRNGHWCAHAFTAWRIVDGARKMRWCTACGRTEIW